MKKKILLIAGHGDGDPGAVANGYEEAKLTREVVPMLRDKLKSYADVTVFDMSKNAYKYFKSNPFNFKRFDYVAEIHFNGYQKEYAANGKIKGAEILVHTSEKGVSVENAILSNLEALGLRNRGVIPRSDLRNMNICKRDQGVSYALIEICFIDDIDDMTLYNAKKDKIISAIADGIISGFGLKKTEITSATDIIQELSKSIEILEVDRAVKALEKAKRESSSLYWILYKIVNK